MEENAVEPSQDNWSGLAMEFNGNQDFIASIRQMSLSRNKSVAGRATPLLFASLIAPAASQSIVAYASTTVSTNVANVAVLEIDATSDSNTRNSAYVSDWHSEVKLQVASVAELSSANDAGAMAVESSLGGIPIVKRGRVELGASASGSANFLVDFHGGSLSHAPLVLVQPRLQKGGNPDWRDTFAAEVQRIDTKGCDATAH
eukprot:SAG25_NODE_1179_length_3680_cov_3.132086_1_plen_202_part_00